MKTLLTLMITALVVLSAGVASAATNPVELAATINGEAVTPGADQPIRLEPHGKATVELRVTNNSPTAIVIDRVEFAGRVVGLTYYAFDTAVDLSVAPGATASVKYAIDLSRLNGQATGLIGATLSVFDDDGNALASIDTVTDVRGSLLSVYGLFGLALLLLTALALLDAALAIARHQLPANRFRRALRIMTPGIGIGLVLVFTLSATRVWVPATDRWLIIAGAFAATFFAIGYLTPTPDTAGKDADEKVLEPQ
ncbi:hypothetical protein [Antrihabitans stalactiti]|uniref:DUF4436 domain-containing protein n=1 Tax=Antrihabitans stalactiti TaxID=2584121 RepID=A0A848KKS7_9NOCA|nr:hypothetical protein [Antrihabitans stalactiti]NMN98751.1 hypothetical protein [Antrihabitans stalactiti]